MSGYHLRLPMSEGDQHHVRISSTITCLRGINLMSGYHLRLPMSDGD
jgi:hypothetical protein